MSAFLNRITQGDCLTLIPQLDDESIDCFLSDIPYGINLDVWDVLHNNTNSALLGQSPAQMGKSAFKRRGKPIQGWNEADKQIPKAYQAWCSQWSEALYPKMKAGSSLFIFGARRTNRQYIEFEINPEYVMMAQERLTMHHPIEETSDIQQLDLFFENTKKG